MSSGLSFAGGSASAKTIVYRPTNDLAESKTNPWKLAKSISPSRKQPTIERFVPVKKSPAPGASRPSVGLPSIPTHPHNRARSMSPRKHKGGGKVRSRSSLALPRSPLMDESEASRQSSHCLVGAPKQTGKGSKVTQSQRLIRILLNDNNLAISKATVDKALQKHTELLKKLQHARETAKTTIDMLETKLDIAGVELEIAKTERNNMENKVKSLRWKLAKERTISKEKLAAAAAALSAPTVATVVRDKDVCLEQLMSRSEHRHEVPMVAVDDSSFVPKLNLDSDDTDSASDATPVMGQSCSALSRNDNDTFRLHARIAALEAEKKEMTEDFEETIEEAQSKIAHLKNVLIACNERRRLAEGRLGELGESTSELAQISQVQPEELVSDIIREKVAKVTGDNSKVLTQLKEATKRKQALELDLETLAEEKDQLKLKVVSQNGHIASLESTVARLQVSEAAVASKIATLETSLRLSKDETSTSEALCSDMEASLVLARNQLDKTAANVKRLEAAVQSASHQQPESLQCADSSKVRCCEERQKSDLAKRTLGTQTEESVGSSRVHGVATEHLDRALRAEALLLISEIKLEECLAQLQSRQRIEEIRAAVPKSQEPSKSDRMREARSALRKAEAKMEEVRARVFSTHNRSAASSGSVKSRIAMLETMSSKSASGRLSSSSSSKASSVEQENDSESSSDDALIGAQVVDFTKEQQIGMVQFNNENTIEEASDSLPKMAQQSMSGEVDVSEACTFDSGLEQRVSNDELTLEETRETLLQTLEDVKKLRKRIAVSETQLNEAKGKLVFLRKVVLSVVPEEQERFLLDDSEAM